MKSVTIIPRLIPGALDNNRTIIPTPYVIREDRAIYTAPAPLYPFLDFNSKTAGPIAKVSPASSLIAMTGVTTETAPF